MFIFALLFLAVAILFLLLCYVAFRIACVRSNPSDKVRETLIASKEFEPWRERFKTTRETLESEDAEPIYIKSFDGLLLHAKLIKGTRDDRLLIFMHGYRSSYYSDFGVSLDYYKSLGFNILLVDQRAHDKSDGRYITYGVLEKFDCKSWINKGIELFGPDVDIVICGISMGASTVLMSAGLQLPENVKAIIADCGFTSPYEIVKLTTKKVNKHIPSFVVDIINFFCRVLAGFDLKEDNTMSALQKTNIPVIFIHGTRDDFVPPEMTMRNFETCASEKELLMIPKATHGTAFLYAEERYKERMTAFVEKYLN